MNLSEFTDSQKQVVTTLSKPLFVAAGAGSGKTFTLKLRTAYAFQTENPNERLSSIHEILAITFTEKAAAELLSRIKDTLIQEGLTQQAFDCELAWISTIHGFCSRLLKENALEIGLNPEFQMITELDAFNFARSARSSVVRKVFNGEIDVSSVSWNWDVIGSGSHDLELLEESVLLGAKVSTLPLSYAAFKVLPSEYQPVDALQSLLGAAKEVIDLLNGADNLNQTMSLTLNKLTDAMLPAQDWLCNNNPSSYEDEQFDKASFLEVISGFPHLSSTFGTKLVSEGTFNPIDAYKHAHATIMYDVVAAFGSQASEVELQLAEAFHQEFSSLKQTRGVLDNNDLLTLTLEALRNHPFLAEKCKRQFRLIMVDEFQDTDKVQIEILSRIAQPGFSNVCVVGDAQQSIYKFRGADISSFFDYKEALQAQSDVADNASFEQDCCPKLADNFRSHADILHFVDAVFGQDCSFKQDGIDYLQLNPKGKVNNQKDPVFETMPRVSLDITHYQKGNEGVYKEIAYHESAERIAKHFAQLKKAYTDAGVSQPQSFALLLGTTKNAQIYIDAFRAEGLESMMTAGSILLSSYEAHVFTSLLQYAMNPLNDQAALDLLTSHLFSISDDALWVLSHQREEETLRHGSIAEGLMYATEESLAESGLSADELQAVHFAQKQLALYVKASHRQSLSAAIRRLLVSTGFLDRIEHSKQVSGFATVGNYVKLTHLLQQVENTSYGLSETVASFIAKANIATEAPGILGLEGADFVQIMTMHGSKGLQFDHVALAEISIGSPSKNKLLAENEGQHTYSISKKRLSTGNSCLSSYKDDMLFDQRIFSLSQAKTGGDTLRLLEKRSKQEALAEARRLLYVGMTRAVKSLYIGYVTQSTPNAKEKKATPLTSDGVMADVYEAFQWGKLNAENPYISTESPCLIKDESSFTYGGSQPLALRVEYVAETESAVDAEAGLPQEGSCVAPDKAYQKQTSVFTENADADNADADNTFVCTKRSLPDMPYQHTHKGLRKDVRSYSSLFHNKPTKSFSFGDEAQEDLIVREEADDPTALGTAFHHLAQMAILQRNANAQQELQIPSEDCINSQVQQLGVSAAQQERLLVALEEWFRSSFAQELCSFDTLASEVPFMIYLSSLEGQPLYLEGEIDALATTGKQAYLIDYKTGGSASETADHVRDKHLFQAQCYACALLQAGYEQVRAVFVRVEQLANPEAVHYVEYLFTEADIASLEEEILAKWSAIL